MTHSGTSRKARRRPPGIVEGHRLIVIRDGLFVGAARERGERPLSDASRKRADKDASAKRR